MIITISQFETKEKTNFQKKTMCHHWKFTDWYNVKCFGGNDETATTLRRKGETETNSYR